MGDPTESIRKELIHDIEGQVRSADDAAERARLVRLWGKVWNTDELQAEFTVHGFGAPFVIATRISTGEKGSLMFQHSPRFYFGWEPAGKD